ncbi:hypothetical protein SLEP1_g54477 [Rubroshorea leprosula]|uniref:Uncharacterized protein n=1 Tax=Rubroshorea leprosula TaxID=152421 RepID=A0AAV5MEZ7_9ROSI|nr:hypothetical protein SLEP1_g54477 [Rubroshorea leprosula]
MMAVNPFALGSILILAFGSVLISTFGSVLISTSGSVLTSASGSVPISASIGSCIFFLLLCHFYVLTEENPSKSAVMAPVAWDIAEMGVDPIVRVSLSSSESKCFNVFHFPGWFVVNDAFHHVERNPMTLPFPAEHCIQEQHQLHRLNLSISGSSKPSPNSNYRDRERRQDKEHCLECYNCQYEEEANERECAWLDKLVDREREKELKVIKEQYIGSKSSQGPAQGFRAKIDQREQRKLAAKNDWAAFEDVEDSVIAIHSWSSFVNAEVLKQLNELASKILHSKAPFLT